MIINSIIKEIKPTLRSSHSSLCKYPVGITHLLQNNYLISQNKIHVWHLFSKECLQPINYQDYQNKGEKELTSSTPTKSVKLDLIGWLFSQKRHACEVFDSLKKL